MTNSARFEQKKLTCSRDSVMITFAIILHVLISNIIYPIKLVHFNNKVQSNNADTKINNDWNELNFQYTHNEFRSSKFEYSTSINFHLKSQKYKGDFPGSCMNLLHGRLQFPQTSSTLAMHSKCGIWTPITATTFRGRKWKVAWILWEATIIGRNK